MALPVVFLGPSLPLRDARRFLEADYRRPIRRGNLTAIPAGAVVAIIDGVFDQDLAVSPREVRSAVARGVRIFGSSSMGALRATEVPGVTGVGRVYEMFRSGQLEDDDEVAVTFDPETLRPLCEPMVNVRYAVARLAGPGTISRAAADAILAAAKALPYRDRTYPQILRAAGLAERADAELLANMLASHDLKREDAITLLERLPPAIAAGVAKATVATGGSTTTLNEEDDRQDTQEAVQSFPAAAPVLFWEFGAALPFPEIVTFLALTGELPRHARKAVARFVLQGNALDIDLSDGPTTEQVSARILDRLMAEWGFFTDEETRTTLGDLGIGAASFEERVDEEVEAEKQVMALVRGGSAELWDALRMELFLDNLALKRATTRLASLRALAALAKKVTPADQAAAATTVWRSLDVRDRQDALRELSWWGFAEADLDAYLEVLAGARRAAIEEQAARRANAGRAIKGLRPFRKRLKPAGEPRFSTSGRVAAEAVKRLPKAVGITRVSMITGLSDLGIPNAQAFRPDGRWSSTIGSGKSESAAGARIGAVMEEVEKWAQERYPRDPVAGEVTASYRQLVKSGRLAVDPATLDLPYDSCFAPTLAMEWTPCHDLIGGAPVLVPSSALTMLRLPHDVYFSQRAGRKIFDTNGLASGFNLEDATVHALCEYVERHGDILSEILSGNPGTRPPLMPRLVNLATVPVSTQRLIKKIEAAGRSVRLVDVRADVRIPTFRARIASPVFAEEQLFGVTNATAFGKASHPNPEIALNMALLEAVQSIMTVTAGAREDLTLRSRSLGRHERSSTQSRAAFAVRSGDAEGPVASFEAIEGLVSRDAREDVRWAVERVRDAGYPFVLLCDLSLPEISPARVVRVIVPGLQTINPFYTGVPARLALLGDLLPPSAAHEWRRH